MSETRLRPLRAVALAAALRVASVAAQGGSVTVTNARNGFAKTYAAP